MKIDKLARIGILGDVRQRCGAKTPDDKSRDRLIEEMSAEEVVATWTGWILGDESWGRKIIGMYKELSKKN